MKKTRFLLIIFSLVNGILFSQVPQKMSYQAVIRNSSNQLVANHAVGMRISMLQGSATGAVVYKETQNPITNANGLISIEIGSGTIVTGTFAAINWANGPYFIQTETDPTGGTNYTIVGTSQLLSVPYALYAEKANTSMEWQTIGNNIFNKNIGNIGIGTISPGCKLDLRNVPIGFSSANKRWEMAYDSTNAYFYIDEYGASRGFAILDGGNVGIGTTNPLFDLHIHNSNTTAAIKFTNGISGNDMNHGADIGQYGNNFSINNWENGSIFFNTNHLQRLAIDPLGNLGIGTLSPAAKLHVNGKAIITDSLGIGTTTPAARLDVEGNVKIVDGTQGNGKVLTSDGNGNASWQNRIGCYVYGMDDTTFIIGGGIHEQGFNWIANSTHDILFTTKQYDSGINDYNTSTGIYTVPANGFYHVEVSIAFDAIIEVSGGSTNFYLILKKNGLWFENSYSVTYFANGAKPTALLSTYLQLVVGDQISTHTVLNGGSLHFISYGNTVPDSWMYIEKVR